ncbi:Putative 30S ribosomal protein S7p/S5e [Rhizopus microsporus]|nr:Putative 30S ribosomal protein S7p/S5e [Rhizopus microsporus]
MSSSLFKTVCQHATPLFRMAPAWTRSMSNVTIVPKDDVVSQLVNTLMRDGKKARAQRLVNDSMNHLSKKIGEEKDPYNLLREAIEIASPLLKISSQKKGSKVVHVPTPLRDRQRRRRAIVWMLEAASKRGEKTFEERFASEVLDVTEGTSTVLQKKLQVHKQALANRANAQVSYGGQR